MPNICYSSETYHLDPQDLFILKDSLLSDEVNVSDEVVLLIGHNPIWIDKSTGTPDTLLKGRAVLEKAVADKVPYVPVRIAFIPKISRFDFISPLIRVLRYKHKFYSSNIYHIDPFEIRSKKIERNFRSQANAYQFSNPKYKMDEAQRVSMYEKLKESMLTNGYNDRYPIDIMLCRILGVQDTLNQGHHRMGVAIDCNIHRIAVVFSAVGRAPRFLHPLFKILARLTLHFKQ